MTSTASYSYREIAKMIDHSLLAPTMTTADFEAGIALAIEYDVASVCIVPCYLRRCVDLLADSKVLPSTVIGFPHGAQHMTSKLEEAELAFSDGAREIDMVVNVGRVLSGDWKYVHTEIRHVLAEARDYGGKLKVIFENCYLTDAHKIRLCEMCAEL